MLTTATSGQGFILLDSRLRPVAYNSEAVQILSFPTRPESIKQLSQFLGDKNSFNARKRRLTGDARIRTGVQSRPADIFLSSLSH